MAGLSRLNCLRMKAAGVECVSAITCVAISVVWVAGVVPCEAEMRQHWPGFRGYRASGVGVGAATPAVWNVATGMNVQWRSAVPGLGHSCPVIWGDRIYVTSAVRSSGEASLKTGLYGDIASVEDETSIRWMLYCYDRRTGDLHWERLVFEGRPRVKRHTKASHANSTPATDGRYVVSFFGSEGLVCFDMAGREIWRKDLGMLDSGYFAVSTAQWGFGSSPVIHEGRVIVQCDVQGQSFVASYRIADGQEIWRTDRDEVPTWGTPTVDVTRGTGQVILNGYRHIGAYALEDGQPLWWLKGGGDIPVPTPVVSDGLVFITNSHGRMRPIYAIRLDAEGDISHDPSGSAEPHVAWSRRKGGNYMQTPIVVGGFLHTCTDGGVYASYAVATGKRTARRRLSINAGYTASPVSGGGMLYFTAETGEVVVLSSDGEGAELAVNSLGEACLATPAIADGMLVFRGRHHLIAIAEDGKR